MQPHPRYEILEKIGSGSYATVYRGRDKDLGRDVAIKQIHEQYLQDPQQLDRYWQEAQLLASFQHPNIVTIYDIVRDRGWLIMELMQGNLGKVSGRKPMDLNALRTMLAHCLRALKFLHAHGILHSDIKPGNIMVDRRRRVKIGDFGLARRASNEEGSLIKGTTKYMAPEIVNENFGQVGPASDLYSLGFSAYELMCGENFESLFPGLSAYGRDKQIAWMMWHAAPDRKLPEIKRVLEGVPEDLATVIQGLTAKSQIERYRTADEALSDLNIDVKLVKTGDDASDVLAERAAGPARQKRILAIGAAAMSVLLCLVMLFFPGGNSGTPTVSAARPVSGIVREIFVAQQKLEIEDEKGIPSEVALGEKLVIQLNGERYILLRDLKKGDRVDVRPDKDPDGRPVMKVAARRPELSRGMIKILNAADGELILEEITLREDVPLRVPPAAKIYLNGRGVALNELRVDDRIEASHLKDAQGQASRVVTRIDALRTVQLFGFIDQIDAAKRRLSIKQRVGNNSQIVPLELTENCIITINKGEEANGRPFGPADLRIGDRVDLQVDILVSRIDASRRLRVGGVVTDIREEPHTVTLQPDSGPRVTFGAGSETEIQLNGTPARFDDLRLYDHLDLTYETPGSGPSHASTIDATRAAKPDRLAILIGVQDYADRNLSRLSYVLEDTKLLRETLIKRYAFAPERILFLADATRETIQQQVPGWLKRTSNLTQVIVYFGGHAYTDDAGRVYLAAKDLNWKNLAETGLPLDWLTGQLDGCVAREKILLLDASHFGKGADLAREPSTAEMLQTISTGGAPGRMKSTAAIASCSKGEAGRDWKEKQHGLFAYVLAEAFSGQADKDRDLSINVGDLSDYLKRRMSRPTADDQPSQTPAIFLP